MRSTYKGKHGEYGGLLMPVIFEGKENKKRLPGGWRNDGRKERWGGGGVERLRDECTVM